MFMPKQKTAYARVMLSLIGHVCLTPPMKKGRIFFFLILVFTGLRLMKI